MTQTLNPATLPVNDNVNPYAFCVDVNGQYFVQKGKMIAYYGQIKFESLSMGGLSQLVAGHFSSPLYHSDWIVATGQGKLILGDRGFDINSFDLEDGNLTVRASSLLGFDPTLVLKQSIVPGFLTLLGQQILASRLGCGADPSSQRHADRLLEVVTISSPKVAGPFLAAPVENGPGPLFEVGKRVALEAVKFLADAKQRVLDQVRQ